MKKIFLCAALAVSALLSSCDMEKFPQGSLPMDEAITDAINARYYRNGFYLSFRGYNMGALNTYTEIQMDNFQALKDTYGNQLGNIFKGDFNSSTSDFAGVWASFYSYICDVNYYLPELEKLIESEEFLHSDHMNMIRYRGEAYFFRAYYYYQLFRYFCEDYSEALKDKPHMGVPLVTEYNPTTDRKVYPGRSTMAETFELIFSDLEKAQADIEAFEAELNSNSDDYADMTGYCTSYVNSWVIKALRARIALYRGDNEEAAFYARDVIENGPCEMTMGNNYANLWLNGCTMADGTPNHEVIMKCQVTDAEAANLGETDGYYWSFNTSTAMYIPANSTLSMYGNNDIRPQIFFMGGNIIDLGGSYQPVTIFSKYYGANKWYSNSSTRGCCVIPAFRLAEMQLILAECSSDLSEQNAALRAVREARGMNYRNYRADQIQAQVRIERNRELIGEGFRLNDLRRYGEGFTRDASTPTPEFPVDNFNTLYFVQGAMDLHYEPKDHRFVWPIPSDEIQVNPQIVGQQNAGY